MSENVGVAPESNLRAADALSIGSVPFDAPWDWLSAGWSDIWRAPGVSLSYGVAVAVASALLMLGLIQVGWQSLILALAGGFLIVGPLFAVGLYDVSRALASGDGAANGVSLGRAITAGLRARGQLLFMGALLFIIYFVWVRIALLLFALFYGSASLPPAGEFVSTLLFTPHGLSLLVVGTATGAMLAALVYSMSVIAVPLLMVERVDAFTAIAKSFEAVRKNPQALGLWAVLIAGFVVLGIMTMFVGLIFAFPLIGHASWHAFEDITGFGQHERAS